jgi:hypothetical protein
MATTGRFGKFAVVFAMVLLIITGIAGLSHGTASSWDSTRLPWT